MGPAPHGIFPSSASRATASSTEARHPGVVLRTGNNVRHCFASGQVAKCETYSGSCRAQAALRSCPRKTWACSPSSQTVPFSGSGSASSGSFRPFFVVAQMISAPQLLHVLTTSPGG